MFSPDVQNSLRSRHQSQERPRGRGFGLFVLLLWLLRPGPGHGGRLPKVGQREEVRRGNWIWHMYKNWIIFRFLFEGIQRQRQQSGRRILSTLPNLPPPSRKSAHRQCHRQGLLYMYLPAERRSRTLCELLGLLLLWGGGAVCSFLAYTTVYYTVCTLAS